MRVRLLIAAVMAVCLVAFVTVKVAEQREMARRIANRDEWCESSRKPVLPGHYCDDACGVARSFLAAGCDYYSDLSHPIQRAGDSVRDR